jgi:hypothetical protein
MQNPMATQVHYDEHQRQLAWVNEENWQFEQPVKGHPVRQAVAQALIALANALAVPQQREQVQA